MVPMRDGVKLATDVYRPSHGPMHGPDESYSMPVVLHRTPYNKDKPTRDESTLMPDGTLSAPMDHVEIADRFSRRGYIVVNQDCR